jgi:hypothetical protein
MSLDDIPPIRRRSTIARSSGPVNNLPVAHVSLGRTWQHRHSADPGQLHIVIKRDGDWTVLCSGARAVRSFRGKPSQAQCRRCRSQHEGATNETLELPAMPAPSSADAPRSVVDARDAQEVPEHPFFPAATRSLLQQRDNKLRRCCWCGDWQYGQNPCTACHTPAQPIARREVS